MEISSVSERMRFYARHPHRFILDARGNFKRVMRLCTPPRRLLNVIRSKADRKSVVVSAGPRHAVIWSTDRCNVDCLWCLRNRVESRDMQHEPLPEMTLGIFDRILDRLPLLEAVSFTGQGEPLLNPSLFDMVASARRRRITTFLTTNGVLLDGPTSERLMKLGLFRVNISLKGKGATEFATVTGRPETVFNKLLENIQNCVAIKHRLSSDMIIRLSYVVDRSHLEYMDEVITLAEELGVDRILFDNLIPFNDFESGEGVLFEDDEEVRAMITRLEHRRSPVLVDLPVLIRRDRFTYCCTGFHEMINVDSIGNVTGCHRCLAPNASFGNVFNDGNCMDSPHFREVRGCFLSGELPNRCRFCTEMSRP